MLQITTVYTGLVSWQESCELVNEKIKKLTDLGYYITDVNYITNSSVFIIKYVRH